MNICISSALPAGSAWNFLSPAYLAELAEKISHGLHQLTRIVFICVNLCNQWQKNFVYLCVNLCALCGFFICTRRCGDRREEMAKSG